MNYTEMLFNRDERLVNLLNQADSKNLELIEEINNKEEEIEKLNNIIDKAIEYIDWQRRNPQYDNVWRNRECEDLIEILKGE